MPFCISCGAENPEGAKFCAKCGTKQVTETAPEPVVKEKPAGLPMPSAPPAPTPVIPQPAKPPPPESEPVMLKPKPAAPEPKPEPKPEPPAAPTPAPSGSTTAKEALKSPEMKPPKGSPKEPIPGAPGQTQFFMAAAQVSTGAKIKRVLIFVIGAIILGTGLFLLIRFAMQKQEEKREATTSEKPAEAATMPAPAVGVSTDGGAAADGETGTEKSADAGKAEAKAEEKKPAEEVKKPAAKKKKKKRRRRRRTR
jgi:hypothetical protein